MLLLQQNQYNNVICTLSERKVTDSIYYLFEFSNDISKEQFYTVLRDDSELPQRFNQFTLLVTGSAIPQSGSLNMTLSGEYKYCIYETSGSTFISSSIGLNQVETGKMLLLPSVTSSIVAFTSSNNQNPVFDPRQYGL